MVNPSQPSVGLDSAPLDLEVANEAPESGVQDCQQTVSESDVDEEAGAGAGSLRGVGSTTMQSIIEPDHSLDDQGYAESISTSYVTSIASKIRRGIEENGRVYAAYGIYKPWLPMDDIEMDRNDLQHCKFTLVLGDKLFLAPIGDHPQKILDLGTGSGIWAIDVADAFPSAAVIGVDTAAVQPTFLPQNVVFEIDDIENEWLWPESSFDFIHCRELLLGIRDWPRLIRQALSRLRPGGYIQLCGTYPKIQSDDGTLPQGLAYLEIVQIYLDMSEKIGASAHEVCKWKGYLEQAGYEDVHEHIFKMPTNPWPKDERLKQIGAFEVTQFREYIAGAFTRGYSQILGGDPAYFEVLLARARQEVLNRNMHSWVPFYVVYGRRPKFDKRRSADA